MAKGKRKLNLLEGCGAMEVSHIKNFVNECHNKNAKGDLQYYALDKSLSNDYAKTQELITVLSSTQEEQVEF